MPSNRDASVGAHLYVVAVAGLAYLIIILVQLPGASHRGDFSIYYACAVATHRGLDPYAIDMTNFTRQLGLEPDPFAHPADTPTFTLVTTPLAMFSASTAYAIWFIASAMCLAASLYVLFGSLGKIAIWLCLGALAFTPLADNFRWAQSQVFVMLGVLLFFRALQRGRDDVAGVLLAALGLLRGYPLVLGGYLIARGRGRALLAMGIAFVSGVALTVAMMGVAPIENFLRILGVIGDHRWFSLDPRWELAAANVSLDAFVARLFSAHHGVALTLKILILAMTYRTTSLVKDDRDGLSLALWIATMLILTPVVWLHYLTLLIIPFGLMAAAATRGRITTPGMRFAMLSYCILVMTTPLMSTLTFRNDIFDWRVRGVAELGFVALISAWIAAWRCVGEKRAEIRAKHQDTKVG
jgi:glycosyl transferase family 87